MPFVSAIRLGDIPLLQFNSSKDFRLPHTAIQVTTKDSLFKTTKTWKNNDNTIIIHNNFMKRLNTIQTSKVCPTRKHALSTIHSSTRTHTHQRNYAPLPPPPHTTAIINQTHRSLDPYIRLKDNQTVTSTQALLPQSSKTTTLITHFRLGDIRLGLSPSRPSSDAGTSASGTSVSAPSVSAPSGSGISVSGCVRLGGSVSKASVSAPSVSGTSVSETATTQMNGKEGPFVLDLRLREIRLCLQSVQSVSETSLSVFRLGEIRLGSRHQFKSSKYTLSSTTGQIN